MGHSSQSDQDVSTSRKRRSDVQDQSNESPRKRKQRFAYLKPQTRRISQELVLTEWKSLPKPAQQQVRDIFLTAKRTTLNQVLDGPRRTEAEFVVNDVLRRLEKQLPRMPFPPNTKVAHLDLDGILEQVRILETEKASLNDSVKLLEGEIEREEKRIELKRKELARLEKESTAAQKARTHRASKTHPLLEENLRRSSLNDDTESIGLVTSARTPPIDFDEPDDDLAPLLSRLQNHFDSIKSNTDNLTQIEHEMRRTRAALSSVLPPQVS
ncbi:uncharacterized protein PV09_02704 [Verruconis gallopava]|uniref:CENP-Q, a CENPA-CAD centromere complex subunit-domain-containing protein n=1 Tax=Verruconis gallopava TaxID=253628 RepID=A0A0D2AH34_9PEZI|nr:uncharacterized protein PV09_02704 [Verruconis gallopava]KIW06228.1 hypothetical protein PV09_02704 [Verruconis gallopava]